MKAEPKTADKLLGKAKRLVGELAGRPDLVLEGEAQDTGLPREDAREAAASPSAGPAKPRAGKPGRG